MNLAMSVSSLNVFLDAVWCIDRVVGGGGLVRWKWKLARGEKEREGDYLFYLLSRWSAVGVCS